MWEVGDEKWEVGIRKGRVAGGKSGSGMREVKIVWWVVGAAEWEVEGGKWDVGTGRWGVGGK